MLSLCFSRSTHIRRNSSECRTRFFATLQLLSAKCANNECLNLGVQSSELGISSCLCVFTFVPCVKLPWLKIFSASKPGRHPALVGVKEVSIRRSDV